VSAGPAQRAGYELEFEDDFRGAAVDESRWFPYYLPHWSSRDRVRARLGPHDDRLTLEIGADHEPWAPEWDGDLKASLLQTGHFSGPVGSEIGQLHFRPDLVVREAHGPVRTYTPTYGYIELRAKALADPATMVALWLMGYEDKPERSGEICVAEIFGADVGANTARVGMGIHPFGDPNLVDEFSTDEHAIDATEFHTYAVDWTRDRVEFFLDDARVKTVHQSPGYPMQLMLGIYEFPDRIDPERSGTYPKRFVVDHVRGYRRTRSEDGLSGH
jgi:hypothetical protein